MSELTLRSVTVAFAGTVALDTVDIAVPAGVVTGLVGPNGAGKTTALQVASGFLRPDRGSVVLDGADVTRWNASRRGRAGVGRTFQRAQLFPSLGVLDNVAIAAERATRGPAAATRAMEALERCGGRHLADAEVGALTTGQRRLVELARGLAGGFRFQLLDEPAAGLTEPERAQLVRVLDELRADGIGVLVVEHDLDLIASVCDQVVVLRGGRVRFAGATRDWTTRQRLDAANDGGSRAVR